MTQAGTKKALKASHGPAKRPAGVTLSRGNTVAWHGRDTEDTNDLLNHWGDKDFRTRSLCIYGDTDDPVYAVVMVKRPVVIHTKHHGPLRESAFQKVFDDLRDQKWGPYIISATGPKDSAIFAGVFTPMSDLPFTRFNLSGKEFSDLNAQQQEKGRLLLWADAFGTPSEPRYAAIWGSNPLRQAWNCDAIDENAADLQAHFEALRDAGCRPAHVAVTPAGRFLEVYADSGIGPWLFRVGMSPDVYQEAFDKAEKDDLLPICVSASGSGGDARFAAIFTSREDLSPRVFHRDGPVAVDAIDDVMEKVVRDRNYRGAALAIVKDTQLVYAKGYTHAEESYPRVQPTTLFRLASVSKLFAAVALWRLMSESHGISLNTTMQSILELTQLNGSAPKDSRFHEITLRHLLESNSGMDQGLLWEGTNASAAVGGQLPATPLELARFAAGRKLTGEPGSRTNVVYGNFDYFMISQVVARLANTNTFEQALNKLVLSPLQMTRTRGSRSLAGAQSSDEARYHFSVWDPENHYVPLQVGSSVRTPARPIVARQYGAVDDYELFDGAGGLSSAVIDVARLMAMFSCRSKNPVLSAAALDDMLAAAAKAKRELTGPDAHGYHGLDSAYEGATPNSYVAEKGGKLPAVGATAHFTTGGFGYIFARNGNGPPGSPDWLVPLQNVAEKHSWPKEDLFERYDMHTFDGSGKKSARRP